MNFTNPLTRFGFGCVAPFILQILIYQTYLWLKPDSQPDFILLVFSIPVVLPLVFFYFLSPYLIFYLSASGRTYTDKLNQSINEIFIAEKEVLTEEEVKTVQTELRSTLIPELSRRFRSGYVNHYFQQLRQDTEEASVLSFYEMIFLFGFFTSLYSAFNGIAVIFLHFGSFSLDGNVIIDQISSLTNVVIFSGLMFGLSLSSVFLVYLSQRRIRYLIPLVIQGWIRAYPDERLEILQLQVKAIAGFNFEDLLSREMAMSKGFMTSVMLDLLRDKVNIIVNEVTREQAGKQLAWQKYSDLLTKLDISQKKKQKIEASFLSSPLVKTAAQFAFDLREFESLKEDLTFFNNALENWEQKSDSEKLGAFLLLYRSAESLFRGILRSYNAALGNFGVMVLSLADLELLTLEEQRLLNQVRKQRNYILHRAGERIDIPKDFASEFLTTLENILVRARERRQAHR